MLSTHCHLHRKHQGAGIQQMIIQTTLMMYPCNWHVDEQNKLKLRELAPEEQHEVIKSIDHWQGQAHPTAWVENAWKQGQDRWAGQWTTSCHWCQSDAVNVDVSNGLVNGARGTVQDIIKTGNEVTLVLFKLDHCRIGAKAIAQSQYRTQHLEAVPISQHEAVFCIGKNKAAEVSRRQFPLGPLPSTKCKGWRWIRLWLIW